MLFVKLKLTNTEPVNPLLLVNWFAPPGAKFTGETVVPVEASTVETEICAAESKAVTADRVISRACPNLRKARIMSLKG